MPQQLKSPHGQPCRTPLSPMWTAMSLIHPDPKGKIGKPPYPPPLFATIYPVRLWPPLSIPYLPAVYQLSAPHVPLIHPCPPLIYPSFAFVHPCLLLIYPLFAFVHPCLPLVQSLSNSCPPPIFPVSALVYPLFARMCPLSAPIYPVLSLVRPPSALCPPHPPLSAPPASDPVHSTPVRPCLPHPCSPLSAPSPFALRPLSCLAPRPPHSGPPHLVHLHTIW